MTPYLGHIEAEPHPDGNRIEVKWENLAPHLYPWVRIMRRERTYPVSPDDGKPVKDISALLFTTGTDSVSDLDNGVISAELLQLFQDKGITLSRGASVTRETASKLWTITDGKDNYTLAGTGDGITAYTKGVFTLLDTNLKGETVYYYALFPFRKNPAEFVVDTAYRTAAMATSPYGSAERMYDLLPRIYHRYDTVLSHKVTSRDRNKGELRRLLDIPGGQLDQLYSFANAALDLLDVEKVDGGLLPLLADWIGWQTDYRNEIGLQRNEIGNAPYVYRTTGMIPNVEAAVKRISGWECRTKEFVHNVFVSNRPERLNLWVKERSGNGEWDDPTVPFSLDYAHEGRPAAAPDREGGRRLFYHTHRQLPTAKDGTTGTACNIWCKRFDGSAWSPSEPLTDRIGINKYPAAALHGNDLWLFWSVFDEEAAAWRLEYRLLSGDEWSDTLAPGSAGYDAPFGPSPAERKMPLAGADDGGGLWLFWLEKSGGTWLMKYNRHDGSGWQLSSPEEFPHGDEILEDPFLLFEEGAKRLYLFWSQRDAQGRSIISYRRKNGIDPGLADWEATAGTLPLLPGRPYHDRGPSAVMTEGMIELFWSSNRDGSWSVWHVTLDPGTETWGTPEQVTTGPYSQRDPLPVSMNGSTLLLYRSNRSVAYASRMFRATETTDFRYAGSTTVDFRNSAKNELNMQYDDFQAYTCDTGEGDDDRYARDTVGLHLKAGTGDPALINRNRGIISQLLAEIMPVQVRSVFSIETVYEEYYGFPKPDSYADLLTGTAAAEIYPGMKETRTDALPDWLRLHSCDPVSMAHLDGHSVDFNVPPDTTVDARYRTWHTGLNRLIEEE